MLNQLNLLIFAYLAISGAVLSYVLYKTDKNRKTVVNNQKRSSPAVLFPLSIVVLLGLFCLRCGLMAGTGVLSGVDVSILLVGMICILPAVVVGLVYLHNQKTGGAV